MITILNTSILTQYGDYSYSPISLVEAKKMVKISGFQSAIGHESTAKIISTLLEIECPVNRILYSQKVGTSALVFKLNGRPEEGKILTIKEIKKIGYSWGKMERVDYKEIREEMEDRKRKKDADRKRYEEERLTKICESKKAKKELLK